MPQNLQSDLTTITIRTTTRKKLEEFSLSGKLDFDEVIERLFLSLLLSSDKLEGLR
ncbi:MAG: hypothetical protein ACREBB_11370 [Nitrosotalea sp.]